MEEEFLMEAAAAAGMGGGPGFMANLGQDPGSDDSDDDGLVLAGGQDNTNSAFN
jgi:hypothetical protein